MKKSIKDDEIRFLPPRDACRIRPSMYIGGTEGEHGGSTIYREILDNAMDTLSEGYGDTILTSVNFEGFCFVADNGKGLPITMSIDKPNMTAAELSISEFHSGSKFGGTENIARIGLNGCGSSACNFVSSVYIILSKITPDNWNKSIPQVKELWEKSVRKKDLFYFLIMKEGLKAYEGAGKLKDLEKRIFNKKDVHLPENQSTIVLFKPDPKIFEDPTAEVPMANLQYFLLIQEKFYKRKVNVVVDGVSLRSTFKPYRFEITKTIVPKDTSANKQVGLYVTFEVDDKSLGSVSSFGSINGLKCDEGAHINLFKNLFKTTLKDVYKIKHDVLLAGLRFCIIILANECQYNSQTKENLKQITKVKPSDFAPIQKEIEKIIKKDPAYWDFHVSKLNILADSMKSINAMEKAQKMIDANSGGVSQYRNKANLPKGFVDATARDRSNCEIFLCFTGETLVTVEDEEGYVDELSFKELEKLFSEGKKFKTDTFHRDTRKPVSSNIIAVKKVGRSSDIVKVSMETGSSFRCTSDHLILKYDGTYEEAGRLSPGDVLMLCDEESYAVTSVTKVKGCHDVYCLEVDDPEHNFLLAYGVFAKNCEGLSAAGSLVAGRKDTRFHAVLGLRGKILNVSDKSVDRALESVIISDIFNVIGLGIDINWVGKDAKTPEEALEIIKKNSRYSKIVVATDADSDGSAIFNEIVYLFSKFARFLLDYGLVYRAISPLFRGYSKKTGKLTYYYPDDPIDQKTNLPTDLDSKKHYDRYKGLGSLSPETGEVYDAFFNSNTRRIVQITPDGIDYSMGLNEDIEKRKALLSAKGIISNPFKLED